MSHTRGKIQIVVLVVGALLVCVFSSASILAQSGRRLSIDHADYNEYIRSRVPGQPDTLYYGGSVVFRSGSGTIYCDTAIVAVGESVLLKGSVILEDPDYRLTADDSVRYQLSAERARAFGDYVELYSSKDSLLAVGTNAYLDRNREYFYMLDRPTVYLNYPDSTALIEVIANVVQYDAKKRWAEAEGAVRISSSDINSSSSCAILNPGENTLDLFGTPEVLRGQSRIAGEFITLAYGESYIERVDVIDSAYAEFIEPTDSTEEHFDRSILKGQRLILGFEEGELASAVCRTQAYSWYFPYPKPGTEEIQNEVSGDSIRFTVYNDELQRVDVVGGAIGSYLSTRKQQEDTSVVSITDTIDYSAHHITYNLVDSLISLQSNAQTKSGTMQLAAHRVELSTESKVVEAFAGTLPEDPSVYDSLFLPEMRPSKIPVILMDAADTLYGDYLEYSIDTEKGRIVTSQSSYEAGKFYGQYLFRQNRDIYYMNNARFTTCDLEGFHFASSKVKLIEGKRLIAKPVVMYIKRLPVLAIPFYVFPLEKGRHSGFLPFTIGNIERGERYVENVGYYWAASEYWDVQGALDYFEERDRLNLYGKFTYNRRYAYSGHIDGNFGRETSYNRIVASESKRTRWTIGGAHQQDISPSFKISADGNYVSDRNFYLDYSTDPEERLNRTIRSKFNFTKRFGKSVSVSGGVTHDENLDTQSRTDQIPSINVSLPAIRPFGSGSKDEDGNLVRHWYNELIVTYRPNLLNYSSRVTNEEFANVVQDTVIDTSTVITDIDSVTADTTIVIDTTISLASQDTLEVRSRREYSRVDHRVSVSMPLTVARYFNISPSFSYEEEWFKIHETDQSREQGIDASQFYRSFVYNTGVSASTKLYGTVHPNVFGLAGLRQVLTPTVGYSYRPELDRNPAVTAYAGGSARSAARSQAITLSLDHLYQAKVKSGESEHNLDLISLRHSASYDFEREVRPWSNLNTTFSSTLLRDIRVTGSATHSLYKKDSDELNVLHPRLLDFDLQAGFSLRGQSFLFDDPAARKMPQGADSASQIRGGATGLPSSSGGGSGWNLSASYSYSESNIGLESFFRRSFINFSLQFSLTPSTRVNYTQSYNFVDQKTVSSRVEITRKLHCWTGVFFWVPTGSLKGWGFKLFVTGLPEVKIDQSQGTLSSSYFQSIR